MQNMDMPDYLDGYQVVLHIQDPQSGVESLVFSTAGLLALNGVNNCAVGIVCNSLGQLNHSGSGLPVAYIHRGVLEKKNFSQAKSFLETLPHATGQNYLLGSPAQIADLECSANLVAEYNRFDRGRDICHTNHPFTNSDFREVPGQAEPAREDLAEFFDPRDIDSLTRFEVIHRQLGRLEPNGFNLEAAKRLLSSHDAETHPVCRHSRPDQRWMTIGTSIMVLDERPELYVCPGPPCMSIFTQFYFSRSASSERI